MGLRQRWQYRSVYPKHVYKAVQNENCNQGAATKVHLSYCSTVQYIGLLAMLQFGVYWVASDDLSHLHARLHFLLELTEQIFFVQSRAAHTVDLVDSVLLCDCTCT